MGNVEAEGLNIDEDEVRERKEEMSRKIEKEKEKIKKDAAKEREDEPEVGLALSLCPWWVSMLIRNVFCRSLLWI